MFKDKKFNSCNYKIFYLIKCFKSFTHYWICVCINMVINLNLLLSAFIDWTPFLTCPEFHDSNSN